MTQQSITNPRRLPVAEGDYAPDFTLADINQRVFTLSELYPLGKVLLVFNIGVT
ncbi:MAG TPA: hypothetical protein PLN80_04905 [Anaerolineaceae bacterium]|jgi:peroxiredoxin|nr:hypothetical protein [Anaerolineaceae bacterium]